MKLLTAEECRSEGRLYGALREQAALLPEFVEALKGVLLVADRATTEFDAARAAIEKVTK